MIPDKDEEDGDAYGGQVAQGSSRGFVRVLRHDTTQAFGVR